MNVTSVNCCPRCGSKPNEQNRLITDSCGHCKCRRCFLADDIDCLDCKKRQECQTEEVLVLVQENENLESKTTHNKAKRKTVSKIPKHIQQVQTASNVVHYHCTICNKTFTSRSTQYYHFNCGDEGAKRYKCEKCEKNFSTRSHLNYHLESHSTEIYHCTQCNKKFKNQIVLKKHQKLHQLIPLSCNECGKHFRCKESLTAHMQQHHLNNPRFQCSRCEKKYAVKSALRQHMLKHFEKKHQCNQCGKRFQRNSTLKLHLRDRHSHSKTDSFICTTCSRKYSDIASLLRHAKLHEDTIKYKCTHCDIITVRKDNMLRHVRNMHIGEDFENCVEIIKPAGAQITQIVHTNEIEETDGSLNSYLPKTVANSSVIKCIGNVEPVKIPNCIVPANSDNISIVETTNTPPTLAVTKLDNVNCSVLDTVSTLNQTKPKKKYDPIEMYLKILISDDEADNEKALADTVMAIPAPRDVELEQRQDAAREKPVQQQRATLHWRKNFKHTYEYQEY